MEWRKRKIIRKMLQVIFLLFLILSGIPEDVVAAESDNVIIQDEAVFTPGMTGEIWTNITDDNTKIKWKSSNKKIAKIAFEQCIGHVHVKALKKGNVTITAIVDGKKYNCKVRVIDKNSKFVDQWCKQWVKTFTYKGQSDVDKLVEASSYIIKNFTYSSKPSSVEDVLKTESGTCYSAAKLLKEMCEHMGFKAEVRFAANDDMSRYPSGVIFMESHYNVRVTTKEGKVYYIDATPQSGVVYVCTKKKCIYSDMYILDDFFGDDW